jgi:iron complex outermembrane receptor protein
VSTGHFTETSLSQAVYAQGTYDLGNLMPVLDDLKLTLGYRQTWDHITGSTVYYGAFSGDLQSTAPTWTVGLDYKLSDGLLFYGKVSRGYKAGGFNTYSVYPDTRTFGPEYDTTYEVGMKSDFHIGDKPARFNLDYYYTDYSKIQRAAGDYNPANQANGAVTLSSASAIIQGIELEGDIKLTPALEVGLNYGYIDAYYTKFPYKTNVSYPCYTDCDGKQWLAGGTLNLACRPLQYIAPNIFSAHLQYDLPIDPALGKITAFVSYSYRGRAAYPGAVRFAAAVRAAGRILAGQSVSHLGEHPGQSGRCELFYDQCHGCPLSDDEYG